MAGTISLSLSQQFDAQGAPLSGGKLYFFQSGTTTPQNSYQDFGLTIVHPNPIILDASGRVPSFYLADGFIKIRLADENGVTVIAADGLLVVGPSTGTGSSTSVDPNSVLQTGDVKIRHGTGTLSGFVRCNGRTIGSAASGAVEFANAGAQSLFEYLWTADANLAVSGGRGATGNADWLANKQLSLPDLRGRTIAGMDDMGSSAAGRLTAAFFGAAATVLGNAGGTEQKTLTAAQLPTHTHSGSGNTLGESNTHTHGFSGTTSGQSATHTHTVSALTNSGSGTTVGGIGSSGLTTTITSSVNSVDHTHTYSGTTVANAPDHVHPFSFTSDGGAGLTGASHSVANPAIVMTFYMKL